MSWQSRRDEEEALSAKLSASCADSLTSWRITFALPSAPRCGLLIRARQEKKAASDRERIFLLDTNCLFLSFAILKSWKVWKEWWEISHFQSLPGGSASLLRRCHLQSLQAAEGSLLAKSKLFLGLRHRVITTYILNLCFCGKWSHEKWVAAKSYVSSNKLEPRAGKA